MQMPGTLSSRILPEEELNRILIQPDLSTHIGLRDRAMLELLGGAGLKVQELQPLCVKNIDLQISIVILFEKSARQDRDGAYIRKIPFGTRTRTALLEYLFDVREQITDPDALLFPGREGGMLSRQAVWKVVKKYAQMAGIDHPVSPEDLRASLAVKLLRQGADPEVVQDLLGIGVAAMKKYLNSNQENNK